MSDQEINNMGDAEVKSGSGDVQYYTGLDYNGLADSDASIGAMPSQVLPSDFNIGAVSADVGTGMRDAQVGLNSDGSAQFSDSLDDRPNTGMDSMAQLATDSHEELLENSSMYGEQEALPFVFPPLDTADAEIEGE